jgi:hypothetical protein
MQRPGSYLCLGGNFDRRFADLPLTIQCYRYYAGWADKIHGQVVSPSGPITGVDNIFGYIEKEPVGVGRTAVTHGPGRLIVRSVTGRRPDHPVEFPATHDGLEARCSQPQD